MYQVHCLVDSWWYRVVYLAGKCRFYPWMLPEKIAEYRFDTGGILVIKYIKFRSEFR